MTMTKQRKEYLYAYQKEKLKRVPLDLPFADYDRLKNAADQSGYSVNGFIKTAITEKIERERPE